jgi:hypothetical protein
MSECRNFGEEKRDERLLEWFETKNSKISVFRVETIR